MLEGIIVTLVASVAYAVLSRGSLSRMRKMKLSPETLANLLYALAWIQRRRKADFIDLG